MIRNNYLIYDDDRTSCQKLYTILKQVISDTNITVYTVSDKDEAYKMLEKDISIIFLDIQLENNQNGIEFAKYVKNTYPEIKIIFITAHIRYCEDIFTTSPSGFLVKPVTASKVVRTLSRLKSSEPSENFIIINNSKNNICKVDLNNIAYIESSKRKLNFQNVSGKILNQCNTKISSIENELPDYFIRCHHSFYINLNYVKDIHRYYFTLTNDKTIPISQTKFKASKESFLKFVGELL